MIAATGMENVAYFSYNDSLFSMVYGYVLELRNIERNIKISMLSDVFGQFWTKQVYVFALPAAIQYREKSIFKRV